MKTLVLGNPNSFWVKEFVQYVLLPMGLNIFLQSNYLDKIRYSDFYANNGVTLIPNENIQKWIMKVPRLRSIVLSKQQEKSQLEYGPFKIVINLFVNPEALSIAIKHKKYGASVYAYFCGSDIIRSSRFTCLRLKARVSHIDKVVCASNSVQKAYIQKIGEINNVSYSTIRFGMSSFKYITNRLELYQRNESKKELKIDPGKITICIGYNANSAQNHFPVLAQLSTLSRDLLDNITILLQMNYGGDNNYISRVEETVRELGCSYRLFRDYMNFEQIAILRASTDIFINAQTTDGLSGSVLEVLFAGALLINASWLCYEEYDDWGISYDVFQSYDEIPGLLIRRLKDPFLVNKRNQEILLSKMSWSKCLESWRSLLENDA